MQISYSTKCQAYETKSKAGMKTTSTPSVGIEPTATGLKVTRSTTELRRLVFTLAFVFDLDQSRI